MSDHAIEQEIQAKGLKAPRITLEQVRELTQRIKFRIDTPAGTTSTFAHAFLDNQFYLVTGHSACVSPENFNAEIGVKIAKSKALALAVDELWKLEGYRLYQHLNQEVQ